MSYTWYRWSWVSPRFRWVGSGRSVRVSERIHHHTDTEPQCGCHNVTVCDPPDKCCPPQEVCRTSLPDKKYFYFEMLVFQNISQLSCAKLILEHFIGDIQYKPMFYMNFTCIQIKKAPSKIMAWYFWHHIWGCDIIKVSISRWFKQMCLYLFLNIYIYI